MKNHILRTNEGRFGEFSVDNLYDNENLIISLPHRVSLILNRFGSVISLDCDLGMTSSKSDFLRICEIDIFKRDYQLAIQMNPNFMSIVRSFDNSFSAKKFIDAYKVEKYPMVSPNIFGEEWVDQVYIHLVEPTYKMTNIEFSVIRANYIDDELLEEPAMTLVGSLKLRGQKAHYFLFVEWWGDSFWSYRKNFFFNNTEFFRKTGLTCSKS